jgi:hypothetical protein
MVCIVVSLIRIRTKGRKMYLRKEKVWIEFEVPVGHPLRDTLGAERQKSDALWGSQS